LQGKVVYRCNQGNIFEEARDQCFEQSPFQAKDDLRDTLFAFFRLGKQAPKAWREHRPKRVDKEYGRMSTVLFMGDGKENSNSDSASDRCFGSGMAGVYISFLLVHRPHQPQLILNINRVGSRAPPTHFPRVEQTQGTNTLLCGPFQHTRSQHRQGLSSL
jgi:hypothetical protein